MALLDKLTSFFSDPAHKRAYFRIAYDHIEKADFKDEELAAGKHYFRLWIAEMFLDKRVDWFREWYPMAHTLVSFQFGDQNLQVPHVAGAGQLQGVGEESLAKMIQLNHQLTSLMPFNGGTVEVVAGLLAMKGKDYIASVVKVMGDLSKLLVVPQLSTALGVALPIASGVQDLLGGGSGQMRLGMHQTFVGSGGSAQNVLRPGYFATIDGNATDYEETEFWVKGGRLFHGASMASCVPFESASHMLFQVEFREQRDDWMSLKNIQDAYNEAVKQQGEGEDEKADLAIKRAIVLARTSPDLTRADRIRVALAVKEDFEQGKGGGEKAVPAGQRNLTSVMARRGIDVDAALAEAPDWEAMLK
jgi:hypothetical protein